MRVVKIQPSVEFQELQTNNMCAVTSKSNFFNTPILYILNFHMVFRLIGIESNDTMTTGTTVIFNHTQNVSGRIIKILSVHFL